MVDAKTKRDVARFAKEGAGRGSSAVNKGPGSSYLNTITANGQYTITVEDCMGAGGGAGGGSKAAPVDNPKGVMPNTPVKIPNIGGPPYLAVGVVVLLGAALLAGRGVLRR